MASFEVKGPYPVKLVDGKNGTKFISDDQRELSNNCTSFRRRGCYIFARGNVPIYVGKTDAQTIIKKAFDPANKKKIDRWLVQQKKKTLVIFTVTQIGKGKTSAKAIDEIESEFIAFARSRNKELVNKKKMAEPKWSIAGLVRAQQGKPSKPARALRSALGM